MLCARASIRKVLLVFRHMGLLVYHEPTYYYHQRHLLIPLVAAFWRKYQKNFLHFLLTGCMTSPLSVHSQKTPTLMPPNFLPKIFTFTGHVKTEKLTSESIVYVQCSKLEDAQILLADNCTCLLICIQLYRKQIHLCYRRLIRRIPLMNKTDKSRLYLPFCRTQVFHVSLN